MKDLEEIVSENKDTKKTKKDGKYVGEFCNPVNLQFLADTYSVDITQGGTEIFEDILRGYARLLIKEFAKKTA